MKNIEVNGLVKIMNKDIPELLGGFGESQRAITAKHIAELHGKPVKRINERINENIDYFIPNVDIIDLKFQVGESDPLFSLLGFNKKSIANSNNIYILSEMGYMKLLKFMDGKLALENYQQVIDEYFKMKAMINDVIKIGDMKRLIARYNGIERRIKETDSIKVLIGRGELPDESYTYAKITNITYDILFGMTAKEIRSYLKLDDKVVIRDYLAESNLLIIKEIEIDVNSMVRMGLTWEQIEEKLVYMYPNKVLPIRDDSSAKKLSQGDSMITDKMLRHIALRE